MKNYQDTRIPTKSPKFWIILSSLFVFIMIVTMAKDWWLTADKPKVWFYVFVPNLTILGGVLSMYCVTKIGKQSIPFLTLLAISLSANTLMQVVENIMKVIYYRIWEYPGILYIVIVIPLGFLLMVYGLILWGKVKGWTAVLLTVFDFLGSVIVGIVLTDVIGITTPGS